MVKTRVAVVVLTAPLVCCSPEHDMTARVDAGNPDSECQGPAYRFRSGPANRFRDLGVGGWADSGKAEWMGGFGESVPDQRARGRLA